MSNMSDLIEKYLKAILNKQGENAIEIKRNEIAEQFECVPSQINYVINTRFTSEKGYVVESKRGGGGYIRIMRVKHNGKAEAINEIIKMINPKVSQLAATHVLERLREENVITEREGRIMLNVIDRETLAFQLPVRDEVRARVMTAMLETLKYF